MSLSDLLQTLEQDAAAEVRALLATAEARATERRAELARDRAERMASAVRECRDTYQVAADSKLATLRRSSLAHVLTARAAMLARVRSAVHALLPTVIERVFELLATSAFACAGSEMGVVRCPPELVDGLKAYTPPSLRVEPAPDLTTGVIVELASGTQIVATLDALFEREAARLEASLVARLSQEAAS